MKSPTHSAEQQSDAPLSGVEGPASKNPLEDRSLDPEVRYAKGMEHIDSQMQRLGDALEGTTNEQSRRRITEQLAELSERRAQIEEDGLQLIDTLDAIEAFRSGDLQIPRQFKILQSSTSSEVIDALVGEYGLQSDDALRQKLTLQICRGRQEEPIRDEILHLAVSLSKDNFFVLPEALAAAAHLDDSRAPFLLRERILELDVSDFETLLQALDGAIQRDFVLRNGLTDSSLDKRASALAALGAGDEGLLTEKLTGQFSSGHLSLAAKTVEASGRLLNESLKKAYQSGKFLRTCYPHAAASMSLTDVTVSQPIAQILAPRARQRVESRDFGFEDLELLAFNPTAQNIELIKSVFSSHDALDRQAAMSALVHASVNLRALGDPEKVARATKLDRELQRGLADDDPEIRRSAVNGKDPANRSHRKELIRQLQREPDKDVAFAIGDKLLPYDEKEERKVWDALGANGHHDLNSQFQARQGDHKRDGHGSHNE